MKSIFLLCDYGVTINTVLKLYEKNITIDRLLEDYTCLDCILGQNSVKKHKVLEALQFVIQDTKQYSIFDLLIYGLSYEIAKLLDKKQITIECLSESIDTISGINGEKREQIKEAYNKFVKDNNFTIALDKEKLFAIISNNYGHDKFDELDLCGLIQSKGYSTENVKQDLAKLVEENSLELNTTYYCIPYPELMDELNKIPNNNAHRDIVMKKLSGMTMAAIGLEYNLTRERVRQIVAKELSKLKRVKQDELADYIKKYDIDVDLFTQLFDVEPYVYYYLKERYKMGEVEAYELMDDANLNSAQIEILKKRYNMFEYDGEYVVARKTAVLTACLKKADKQISYGELIDMYNSVVTDKNLDLELMTEKDVRKVEALLMRNHHVLNSFGKQYRYYDLSNIDEEVLQQLKALFDVEPGVYSAGWFFNENPLLMKRIDVRDEYELHNLFRKILGDLDNQIVYSKMPDMYVRCLDKNAFVENKIKELSPITIDDFLEHMYKNYGHKPSSFKAFLATGFNQYKNGDMLISKAAMFDEYQYKVMKEFLTEDVYSIATIRQVLIEKFDVNDFSLINSLNLDSVGYKLRDNYILKNNITNIESYFRNKILSSDYYEVTEEMKKMGSTFYTYLYRYIYEMLLFKIDEDRYITITKLNSLGITTQDITDFIENIKVQIPENEYFNLHTLNMGFSSKLFNHEFPASLYETIIMTIPNVKMLSLKNNNLFVKTQDNVNREKFISSIIKGDKMYVKDIKNVIKNKYGIDLELYYIRQFINKNRHYLDNSTDCVYSSRQSYEDDINKWDILQYID